MNREIERLRNDEGEYPWETVRWGYGIGMFAFLPAVVLLPQDGPAAAAAGFCLGCVFLAIMAAVAWRWPI